MKRKNVFRLLAIVLALSLLLGACRGSSGSEPPANDSGSNSSDAGDSGSTDSGDAPDDGTGGEAAGDPPSEDPAGDAVPDDVPVMPGAYNLDVIREGSQINFYVDAEMEEVMAYYATELAALGWEETRTPDSAIGSIGSMVRQNAAEDALSISMSYNANGGFTVIQIAVSRAD
jgi:hypothetical protein